MTPPTGKSDVKNNVVILPVESWRRISPEYPSPHYTHVVAIRHHSHNRPTKATSLPHFQCYAAKTSAPLSSVTCSHRRTSPPPLTRCSQSTGDALHCWRSHPSPALTLHASLVVVGVHAVEVSEPHALPLPPQSSRQTWRPHHRLGLQAGASRAATLHRHHSNPP
jgi:hypothetical protein